MNFLQELWAEHRNEIIGCIIGVLIGIMILAVGFLKTLFIVLCGAIGYYVGKYLSGDKDIREKVNNIFHSAKR
ncbi:MULTISPECIES: DUF2273 domain-containing protein [Tepidanaerobacter]|uniref:Uncharacterized membrane protein n=1 Tax=Tepidanaerobacter syntrophicus TaxID=224999 RepID=A0A0U9HL53_9FIRM|nr:MULTISPECIES: DUF2273 domain-containing protein [Tepidanaerobacter]GAQ26124.1 uncharacterized membrane protein [Tepidanaerobacter syntrophicus]GLI19111.1 hypothetical protein TSYNTROPHJE_09240 [Tepidanaerobacter syntrophicus]GLI50258.1 hypothetical protein TSYNTROOL_03440 [Tepidanaerobacter syntrophicus]HHV82115.1 DUF2273 domain-containing protein [Tepidanaerobacter syntrophicus]